jgi:hypothetical protein
MLRESAWLKKTLRQNPTATTKTSRAMPDLTPEQLARQQIDAQRVACGWVVQDYKQSNPAAGRGIALREAPLKSGTCDYLLLVDRQRAADPDEKSGFEITAVLSSDPRNSRREEAQINPAGSQSLVTSSATKPLPVADGVNVGYEVYRTSLSIEPDDFDYAPFSQRGGLGKAHRLFGEQLPKLLDELNEVLAA